MPAEIKNKKNDPWFEWVDQIKTPQPLHWKARVLVMAPPFFGVVLIPLFFIFVKNSAFFWAGLAGFAISIGLKTYFVYTRTRVPSKSTIE